MNWLKISAIDLALAVGMGAFGAHGLKKVAGTYEIDIWHTATLYLFVHALGLLVLGVLQMMSYQIQKVALTLQIGIMIFSGSLYLIALGLPKWLGMITPIGGVMMIIGWVLLAVSPLKKEQL